MSVWRLARVVGAVAAAGICLSAYAHAHDPRGIGTGLPKEHLKRIAQHMKALESLDDSEAARGMYSTMVVWAPTYPKLRVCFFGGTPETNAAVATVANQWVTQEFGLKLDFGKADNPRQCDPTSGRENQIRVSYDKPGYWSHIGQNAVVYAKQEEASLNLSGFDKFKPEELAEGDIRGIILHEFGHSLGLLHEHQSPALQQIVITADAKGRKGVSIDFVKTFYERKGTADDPDDGQ